MLNIRQNILLKNYTTFRIGGPARFFVEVKSEKELLEALNYTKENSLEFFILGGGSNLLVSDKGYSGIVIKIQDTCLAGRRARYKIQKNIIEASAGAPLALLVSESVNSGLTGLEWAAGIPGTIGGAIRGNARAYGKDTKAVTNSVRALDVSTMEIKNFSNAECKFRYWGSVFKENLNLIILSAKFELRSGNKEEGQNKVKEIIAKRMSSQPKDMASPGSFFLNPVVTDEKLRAEFEREVGRELGDEKLPAGWLIDQAGLKGKKIGGAMVSEKHANFIVNTGGATAEDVIMLASIIKQQVRDKFGIELESEVQYLGF